MKLDEIADRIHAHLKRFENDSVINAPKDGKKGGLTPYFCVNAWRAGSRVGVTYIAYQGSMTLTKIEAEKYLTWLDAGNVGRHWSALRAMNEVTP